MYNNMMELSLEEMKVTGGTGLLGSIGQLIKTVTNQAPDGTKNTPSVTNKAPEVKKESAKVGNPASENVMMSIFTNLTKCFLKSL